MCTACRNEVCIIYLPFPKLVLFTIIKFLYLTSVISPFIYCFMPSLHSLSSTWLLCLFCCLHFHDVGFGTCVPRHGYGKWQAIIEDRELGIQEIVCQEQNLPYLNSSTMGNVLGQEGAYFPNSGANKVNGPGIVSEAAVEDIQENTKGNQLPQESYMMSDSQIIHFREVQRRLVEFVKKRVILLEKALSLEYQKTLFVSYELEVLL